MKTIIIPTDFSPAADNALEYGINMAKELKAGITLFHVYQVPVTTTTDTPIILVAEEDMRKAAEGHLKRVKSGAESRIGADIRIETELRLGDTVTELEDFCKKVHPFAVIMGTNGYSGFDQVLFGSTTLRAIRNITSPVIAVPSEAKYKNIQRIGFACDYKQVAETTPVALIREIVNTFQSELHVLNVNTEKGNGSVAGTNESAFVRSLFDNLKPAYHFIENESVEEGVNGFAEKNNLDLLIVIPKKHSLLDGLFHRSATRQLVFHSHIPVLSVHE